jgi:hemoglobin
MSLGWPGQGAGSIERGMRTRHTCIFQSCISSSHVSSNLKCKMFLPIKLWSQKPTANSTVLSSIGQMSKLELQRLASERSGVTYEESLVATEQLSPSIYERFGEKGIRRLSESFYDRVFADKETAWFLNIFSSSTRAEAVENQYLFFVQTFGGPDLYRQKKGKYTRLVGRHANYNIGPSAADRWVEHMMGAIREDDTLTQDALVVEALDKYFRYTAHYIVVASEYMRPDQVRAWCEYKEINARRQVALLRAVLISSISFIS